MNVSGERLRGFVYYATMALSDDRLDGSTIATGDWDESEKAGIYRGTRVIENADGTWEGTETLVDDGPSGDGFYTMMDLVGTGAYEGLSAILFMDNTGAEAVFRGSIYPTDLAACDFAAGG